MKHERILDIYRRLVNKEKLICKDLALEYGVTERSVQRDIKNLADYLEKKEPNIEIKNEKGNYILGYRENNKNGQDPRFTSGEVLAICKILLDSRALIKEEMNGIINKILNNCIYSSDDSKFLKKLIKNEQFHYIELTHKKSLLENINLLGQAIVTQRKIRIRYKNMYHEESVREVCPVGLMFSEYYFYFLIRENENEKIENKRVDRIVGKVEILDKGFSFLEYNKKVEEGEIRKVEQFMTRGEMKKIKMVYRGGLQEDIPEYIRDKFPTLKEVGKTEDGKTIFEVKVFGWGIDLWLYGQDDRIEIIEEKIVKGE